MSWLMWPLWPFLYYGLTLISVSNYIHYIVWGEITNPFPNSNGAVEVCECMNNFIWHLTGHVVTCSCWGLNWFMCRQNHYDDVIMTTMASQITSPTLFYSIVYSGADQRKHQSSASLALVRGIHRGPVNSPHKWPVTRKRFPFDDVIMMMSKYSSSIHTGSALKGLILL